MRKPKILTTMREYDAQLFVADLVAGITVAMVALPLSLAIAIASGAGPEKGLITAIVGGFLISLFGGSRVQIGGPTGAFIVVVFAVIAEHGYDGLILATFMAGIILLIAGFFHAGRLIALVPEAVVQGFTIGIGIIIATSQIKDFLGLSIDELPADFLEKVPALWEARETLNLSAFSVAIVTLLLIVFVRKLTPRIPGIVIAVIAGSFLAFHLETPVDTLFSRFGPLPSNLPVPAIPVLALERLIELFPSALIIAFLAGVESLLSAMVADRMIKGQHRPNAELIAQGLANLGSALFNGIPATGAIARTATNVGAGGKTPVSGIICALSVFLVMFLAGPLVGMLAMPSLAAVLIIAAWNMSEPHKWGEYLTMNKGDQMLLLITFLLTVLVDLTVAIGTGVAIGLALKLQKRNQANSDWTEPER